MPRRSVWHARTKRGCPRVPQVLTRDAPTQPSPTESSRILIIDDNPGVVETLKMLLDLNGYTTHTAHDTLECLKVAEQVRPAIILLDIGLPKIDGWERSRRIRQQAW